MNVNYVILIPHFIPGPREKVCDGPALVSLTLGLWKIGSSRRIKEIWSEKFDFQIIICWFGVPCLNCTDIMY